MNERPERDWWELVEEHLARLDDAADGEHSDDPWDDGGAAPALTDAQRALLGGIDDQPGVPRVTHDGEHEDQPPVPRFAHRDDPDDDVPGPRTGNIPGDSP